MLSLNNKTLWGLIKEYPGRTCIGVAVFAAILIFGDNELRMDLAFGLLVVTPCMLAWAWCKAKWKGTSIWDE